ncbi:hypothetical protein J2X12_004116 [Pseudarthrobacter oxydans]|uniref:Uncharacterized protein n=1 Tax=Pseudarthrobacter oxydans TaxID=1671 RepID=A0AAW8NFE3_PSEOX|nr:hypothetical protein [Pseudarthrobacter oxydans]MDR6794736.1 hypothetical protein [Pseudarthrobacter oxydans]MDR7166062.1 hypothetical protein [Pseudarthrobacter oxydans]
MYSEDTVQRVISLMRDTFGDAFKTYYDGDPEAIPVFNLPAIIVTQTGDSTAQAAFAQDDVEDQLTIKVVLNKRDDWTGDAVDPLNMTERKIREFVGKLDGEGKYGSRTVKGALRNYLLEGVTAVAPTMTVDYGINPRVAGEGLADITAEGHVSFSIKYAVETNPR